MSTPEPIRFWYHAEPVLSAVHRFGAMAERARAQTVAVPSALPAGAPGPGITAPRDEVTEVTGFDRPLSWGETTADVASDPETLRTLEQRSELRESLRRLERRLAQDLRGSTVRQIMHVLVIHADERVMAARPDAGVWTPLQLEFFDFDDGGERFYAELDELLGQPDTPDLVFEVYYYCLRDGFGGLYAENTGRIEDYLERIERRLVVDLDADRRTGEDAQVELVEFPYRYYLIGLAVVLFGVGLLWVSAAVQGG